MKSVPVFLLYPSRASYALKSSCFSFFSILKHRPLFIFVLTLPHCGSEIRRGRFSTVFAFLAVVIGMGFFCVYAL